MGKRALLIMAFLAASLGAHAVSFTCLAPPMSDERIDYVPQLMTSQWEVVDGGAPVAFLPHGYRLEDQTFETDYVDEATEL